MFSHLRQKTPILFVFFICVSVEIALVLLDLCVNWWQWSDTRAIRRLFNTTREDGLASLFAVIQTFSISLVLWVIYIITKNSGPKVSSKKAGWLVLAIFFTYMTIDDGAVVHERIGTAFKTMNPDKEFVSYGWQMILAPLFVLMGCYICFFLWMKNSVSIRKDWLIAAIGCLGIAVVIDFIEGTESGYLLLSQWTGMAEKTITHFGKSFEEFLEMLGMSFFLILFLNHLILLTHSTEVSVAQGRIRFNRL